MAVMMAWGRLAMVRSGSGILAIASSTSRSPSTPLFFARASAFSSLARSRIAARSSAENPPDFVAAVAPLVRFRSTFFGLMEALPLRSCEDISILGPGTCAFHRIRPWAVRPRHQ